MTKPQAQPSEKSIDLDEVAKFSALADEWWDESGPFKPLHRMNPVRVGYINDAAHSHFNATERLPLIAHDRERGAGAPEARAASERLNNLSLLDIGCGGGLIAEPMARAGYHVTAIDASEQNIHTAAFHATQSGLAIDYRATSAEALATTGAQFDVILALEIIEHVADIDSFMDAVHALLKPGGLLILSTLNRTPKAFLFAIVGAEYLLRLLPRGTHEWKKFLRPSELARLLRARHLNVTDTCGMVMHPLTGDWSLNPRDLDVNYLITATKPA